MNARYALRIVFLPRLLNGGAITYGRQATGCNVQHAPCNIQQWKMQHVRHP